MPLPRCPKAILSRDEQGRAVSANNDPADLADARALLIAGPRVTNADLVHLERLARLQMVLPAPPGYRRI